MNRTSLDFETKRKLFHILSIIFPIIYMFTSKIYMILFLFAITSFTLYIDISRHYNSKIKDLTENFFQKIMRSSEKSGYFELSGSSFMALGFLLSGILFPKGLAITCWLILIVSDSLAAIVGSKMGATHFKNRKSLEGAIAFFASAFFISLLGFYFIGFKTNFIIVLIACIVATCAEFFSNDLKINDNLSIPLSYGLITLLLSLFL